MDESKRPLWPSLEAAWNATGASSDDHCDDARWQTLKSEPRTRVLRLEAPGHPPLILKIYAYPGHLAWRTLGMVSRANREFTVMMGAHQLGLPVARPRYWLEQRAYGGLRFSALALETVAGTNLETRLESADCDSAERRGHAEAAGGLLGRFHRAGLNWATAAPRNLLITEDDDSEPLRAIDMPYATLPGRDISTSDEAALDRETLIRMSNGDVAYSDDDQQALWLAYCAGNEAAAQALSEGVVLRSHLSWKGQRLKRRVRNLLQPTSKSAGRGGEYRMDSGEYRVLDGPGVFLDA